MLSEGDWKRMGCPQLVPSDASFVDAANNKLTVLGELKCDFVLSDEKLSGQAFVWKHDSLLSMDWMSKSSGMSAFLKLFSDEVPIDAVQSNISKGEEMDNVSKSADPTVSVASIVERTSESKTDPVSERYYCVGTSVCARWFRGNVSMWIPGIVTKKIDDVNYLVDVTIDGKVARVRKNRRLLKLRYPSGDALPVCDSVVLMKDDPVAKIMPAMWYRQSRKRLPIVDVNHNACKSVSKEINVVRATLQSNNDYRSTSTTASRRGSKPKTFDPLPDP
jgi:hypothetical protein